MCHLSEIHKVHLKVGIKVEAYWCVRDWDNKTIWRAHELYMMLLILVIPTAVMAVAYTAICCEIWEVIQRRQNMTCGKGHEMNKNLRVVRTASCDSFPSSNYTTNNTSRKFKKKDKKFSKKDDDGSSVKQVIKMLVAVVVIFVLCWGPMLIDNVLQAYGILTYIRIGWPKYMGTAFHLMAYFNSCINPIVYGFMSKNFRESFMKALCCRGNKPKVSLRSFSLSQTRNTSIRYAESSLGRTVSVALPV
ncbi:hypothetical protein RUM44_009179 [Polyplax serrata]|uniref:G-protein coupled receptors family 1 profile domain-containing protein n=1 Tax=Polyplax serrata TaxID=468196 RepID=A0ABR1AS79_POLSC